MKTLYESLLDDEEDLLNAETAVIQGLLNKELLMQSRDVFYNDVKKSSKKIKTNLKDIQYGEIIQPNKIYVAFRPKYPEQITLLYKPEARKNNLCQMNTSYARNKFQDGYRWVTCHSYLRIVAGWLDKTYELYELPEKYYPLWDAVHKKINPSDKTFDIK